jgi:hypothetical protein
LSCALSDDCGGENVVSHDTERESTELEDRTRALFDASVENLDGRTRSRLTQARHAALAEIRAHRAQPWRRAWLPMSGVATVAALAVWITLGPAGNNGAVENGGLALDDLDIVAEAPNLDLLEDVEFYAWIANEAGEPPQNGHSG